MEIKEGLTDISPSNHWRLIPLPLIVKYSCKLLEAMLCHDRFAHRASFHHGETIPALTDLIEARFEQAFSADGGATWEVNWIAVDRRTA